MAGTEAFKTRPRRSAERGARGGAKCLLSPRARKTLSSVVLPCGETRHLREWSMSARHTAGGYDRPAQ